MSEGMHRRGVDGDKWIEERLALLRAAGQERDLTRYPEIEPWPREGWLNFSSNDYLQLSHDPRVVEAARSAQAAGTGSSRLVTGNWSAHIELERALAAFKGTEEALLFGAGYLANIGLLSALIRREDTAFSDRLIHASLIDGLSLSRCRHRRFRHSDAEHLRVLLRSAQQHRKPGARFYVVLESVYSMDGDLAPLADLAAAAREFDADLIVDEAHALGVFGRHGAGLAGEADQAAGIRAVIGTMSKALGSCGGFVASTALLKRLLLNYSRPLIYSTSLPPGVIQAAAAALRIIAAQERPGGPLLERAAFFRRELAAGGLNTMSSGSQIVPVLIGDNSLAVSLAQGLCERGVIVRAIRAPTVPPGTARLRFSVTLAHTLEDLSRTAQLVVKQARALRICGG